jgi:serine/threonine protein kinase
MNIENGTSLGHYQILAPLGTGGMGEVYRAQDTRLKREVAIKILPSHVANNPDSLSRFEREALALAQLSHPNILAIHDFGRYEGVTLAATELLSGENLRARIERGPIPTRRVLEIAAAIAEGLAAAHSKGIVHRDLKPENVFLTSDDQVKILDFGLARVEVGGAKTEGTET